MGQIERALHLPDGDPMYLVVNEGRVHGRDVHAAQPHGPVVGHSLNWLLVLERKEGAQDFMPANDLRQAALDDRLIDRTEKRNDGGDVVGRLTRREPVQEPQPLLAERKRSGVIGTTVSAR